LSVPPPSPSTPAATLGVYQVGERGAGRGGAGLRAEGAAAPRGPRARALQAAGPYDPRRVPLLFAVSLFVAWLLTLDARPHPRRGVGRLPQPPGRPRHGRAHQARVARLPRRARRAGASAISPASWSPTPTLTLLWCFPRSARFGKVLGVVPGVTRRYY